MSDSDDSEVAEAWIDEVTEAVNALEQWRDETNMRLDNIEARLEHPLLLQLASWPHHVQRARVWLGRR